MFVDFPHLVCLHLRGGRLAAIFENFAVWTNVRVFKVLILFTHVIILREQLCHICCFHNGSVWAEDLEDGVRLVRTLRG